MKKQKTPWRSRPRVRRCPHWEMCDCMYCKVGFHCLHDDSYSGDCTEESCPLWNGKKWKPN